MSSIFDLYLKESIMVACEAYFNDYLESEGVIEEALSDEERKTVSQQIDIIIDMMGRIYKDHDDEFEAYGEIVDKLIGFCIVAKMNEARLCRLLNEAAEKLKDI